MELRRLVHGSAQPQGFLYSPPLDPLLHDPGGKGVLKTDILHWLLLKGGIDDSIPPSQHLPKNSVGKLGGAFMTEGPRQFTASFTAAEGGILSK